MKKLFLFGAISLLSSTAFSAASLVSGKIESVTTYEECIVIKLESQSNAFVYPLANPSAKAKLSMALSALHTETNVELAYWATSTCTSLDSQPEAAPTGNKRYIYNLKLVK